MKVTVSVPGRFWAFYTAQELLKHGWLEKLITSYPKFEVAKYGIPKDKIVSLPLKEMIERGWRRLPVWARHLWNPQFFWSEIFDRQVASHLPSSDIFIAYSNFALHSFVRAKEMGSISVLERGSSHMKYQQRILKEEYERWGVRAELAHPKIVEKELREYEAADYVIVPSYFVKRTFLEEGFPEEKLIHIPFGVDLSQFHPVPKKDNVFRIIFTGGMTLRKGVHYLLEAYVGLNLPNSELLLIGSFNEEIRPFFKKYEGKFRWIGHIPQAELHKHYSQGSVFVMMSLEEGLALVQPQAMACGLPLIATPNTGAEDLIENGKEGFIIPLRDVATLREKLIYLYEHEKERAEMGKRAREKILNGFSWADYGEKLASACERIMLKRL